MKISSVRLVFTCGNNDVRCGTVLSVEQLGEVESGRKAVTRGEIIYEGKTSGADFLFNDETCGEVRIVGEGGVEHFSTLASAVRTS